MKKLTGDDAQLRFLREAVDHYRLVLMRFGGLDVHVDRIIADRDDSMSAWQVKIQEALDETEML